MDDMTVERSIWIDAPREQVWQAVTEPDQIAQWFLPVTLGAQMQRHDDGRLSVLLGPMAVDVARLEALEPPHRVTSRALPDGLLATIYTLEEADGGTQLTVTMSGIDALPADARRDRLQMSGDAWDQTLQNLKAHVAGTEKPFPQAGVAALFGFWRDMKEKIAVERSIWIKATRERVWQAITDPDQISQWFSPGTQWRGTGLIEGGRLSVYDAENDTDMYVQVIEKVDPPYQLITRSEPAPEEVPQTTIWTLQEENQGTRLTITHTGYELQSADERPNNMEQNTFGFGMMLENLRALVEGQELPYPGGF
ncbi:MAG: hypothetical protein CL610_11995 [Anaerolineaceae bacterium]|nr:hypothetical protein [Anaerolineaceae bacterium]